MKKFLLTLFLYNFFTVDAQTSVYHPFPDSNALWNMHYQGGLISCHGQTIAEDFSYLYSGDTMINSVTYHQLFIPYVIYQDTCQAFHAAMPGYKGGIRQDTATRKVFFIPSGSATEQLLYDFNLQVGDSINTYEGSSVIDSVDSILIGNNYRKRWILSELWQPSIIEGIGSTAGPIESFFSGMPDGPRWSLTCFSQNDIVLYPYLLSSCNVVTGNTDFTDEKKFISFIPNPFHTSTILTIDLPERIGKDKFQMSGINMIIYDLPGKAVRHCNLTGNRTEIERGDLQSGIYFVKIYSGESQWIKKLVIQ